MLHKVVFSFGTSVLCRKSAQKFINILGSKYIPTVHQNCLNKMASRKKKSAIILLDMDGVLADFEGYFLKMYQKKFPGEEFCALEERNTFYLYSQYPDREKVQSILNAPGFFRNLPPIAGAIEAVKEMSTMDGIEVFLCTTPMMQNYRCSTVEKYEWVEEYLGKYWLDRLILTVDKTVIKGDILIDDKHFISGAENNPSWKHILFTSCHNHQVPLKGRKRLDGWLPHEVWKELLEDVREEVQRKSFC